MKTLLKLTLSLAVLGLLSAPVFAGNIALTGHDDDFHYNFGPNKVDAGSQLAAMVKFAENGSSLPVLTFDAGSELTDALTGLGISFTNVNPDSAGAVTASLFNASTYSAFVVASDGSCGGCDNDATGEVAIAAQSTAIDNFLNAGGGIVGLAGADSTGFYDFVPQTATSVGGAPSTGYSQTSVGATYGINAVNGDETHNLFQNPGTDGESSFYQVAEVNSFGNSSIPGPNAAATLICVNCTTTGGVITGGGGSTPEPASLVLLGTGLLALGILAKRKALPVR
ncbi:MAG TPA: PEP-CTERM sorting domain-containing protein [Terriglobia bacterium]|nr:PEP-CTERM sorting domain-containing protein [Terriglobia bacterium]